MSQAHPSSKYTMIEIDVETTLVQICPAEDSPKGKTGKYIVVYQLPKNTFKLGYNKTCTFNLSFNRCFTVLFLKVYL